MVDKRETADIQVGIRMTPTEKARLDRLCKKYDMKMSGIVRWALMKLS